MSTESDDDGWTLVSCSSSNSGTLVQDSCSSSSQDESSLSCSLAEENENESDDEDEDEDEDDMNNKEVFHALQAARQRTHHGKRRRRRDYGWREPFRTSITRQVHRDSSKVPFPVSRMDYRLPKVFEIIKRSAVDRVHEALKMLVHEEPSLKVVGVVKPGTKLRKATAWPSLERDPRHLIIVDSKIQGSLIPAQYFDKQKQQMDEDYVNFHKVNRLYREDCFYEMRSTRYSSFSFTRNDHMEIYKSCRALKGLVLDVQHLMDPEEVLVPFQPSFHSKRTQKQHFAHLMFPMIDAGLTRRSMNTSVRSGHPTVCWSSTSPPTSQYENWYMDCEVCPSTSITALVIQGPPPEVHSFPSEQCFESHEESLAYRGKTYPICRPSSCFVRRFRLFWRSRKGAWQRIGEFNGNQDSLNLVRVNLPWPICHAKSIRIQPLSASANGFAGSHPEFRVAFIATQREEQGNTNPTEHHRASIQSPAPGYVRFNVYLAGIKPGLADKDVEEKEEEEQKGEARRFKKMNKTHNKIPEYLFGSQHRNMMLSSYSDHDRRSFKHQQKLELTRHIQEELDLFRSSEDGADCYDDQEQDQCGSIRPSSLTCKTRQTRAAT